MKGKYTVILLLALMLFPVLVNALDGQVTVSCEDTVIGPGGTLTCSISGNSFSALISSFHAKITLGEGLTLMSVEKDSSWLGSGDGGIIDLYTDVNKTGDVNFASFVIKADDDVSDNVVVNIEEIIISDDNFIEYNFEVISTEIEVSNATTGVGGSDGGEEPEVPEDHIFNIGENYEILNNVIANIDIGTTVDGIDIEANHDLIFYDVDGEVVDSGRLMTGYKVTDGFVEYTLIIKGDVNGDGYSNSDDARLVSKHILDIDELDGIYLLSANIDFNDSVDINDIIKLVKYMNEISA